MSEITPDEDDKVISIKERFKLITGKVINTVTRDEPTLEIDDRTLMKCFMKSDLYKAFIGLYSGHRWIVWERTAEGFKISLRREDDEHSHGA